MSGPILEMKNINKSFPGVRALKDVNLSVSRGEVHCLIGANGAGKSTPALTDGTVEKSYSTVKR
jgi:ABC-type sugar transport system ATPase subunit